MPVLAVTTLDTISFLLIGVALLILPVVIAITAREGGGKTKVFVTLQILAYLAIFGYILISHYFFANLVEAIYTGTLSLSAIWVIIFMIIAKEEGALH